MGMLTREPSLVLSKISTESLEPGPHAFIMLNKDNDMIKHIIFDIENPSLFEINSEGKKSKYIGLYSLTDEEYNDLVDGFTCSPKSLFELVYHFKEISEKNDLSFFGKDVINMRWQFYLNEQEIEKGLFLKVEGRLVGEEIQCTTLSKMDYNDIKRTLAETLEGIHV